MRRGTSKKGAQKPQKRRREKSEHKSRDHCRNCEKDLSGEERALFVEEDVGRVFCSEKCITQYFNPEIQKLEKEYFRRLSTNDLSGEERESLAHLRWLTLQDPDEVWCEKTLAGDMRFTLISEFKPDERKIWCVCICLFLRGEPSFLYLAFPTRNAAMANYYRKGERVQVHKKKVNKLSSANAGGSLENKEKVESETGFMDGLADEWTEDETLRAQLNQGRNANDIPMQEYSLYQSCLEETLQAPDEVWSIELKDKNSLKLYHFLRHYPDEIPEIWYVIVAKETEDEEQIEILDAFPTRDAQLIEQFRIGKQEIGQNSDQPNSKMVH